MAQLSFDDLIPQGAAPAPAGQLSFDDLIPSTRNKGRTQEIPQPGILATVADTFTGASRTEFPEAGEFGDALTRAARAQNRGTVAPGAIGASLLTSDQRAQLDILKKHIPGLESQEDRHGNIMLRAPGEGVTDWTYLNAPGASARDVGEFAAQTAAASPLLRYVGAGSTLLRRGLIAAGLMGGGEIAKDAAATAAGSEQGVDLTRAAVTAGLGGVTAPGVPTALAQGAGRAIAAPFEGVTAAVRGVINPEREASRRVGSALVRDEAAGVASLTDADRHLAAQTAQPLATIDQGGDTTRALARSAANTSPEARGTLERFIGQRFETQAERVGDQLTNLVGGPGNAHAIQSAITQGQRTTLPPLYQQAYRNGAVGVHTPGLAAIEAEPAMRGILQAADQAMQRKQAAGTIMTAARGPTGNPTLEYWDQAVRTLADQTNTLRQSGAREQARDVGSMRARLLQELDTAFPGYANARGTAATFFKASDALEAGEMFARQNYDIAAARTAINAMSPNEQAMFRQGYASHMLERLNNVNDRRSVVNQVVGSPAAREKLEIALGPNAAREMEAFMHIETIMDLPRNAMGNSTTARQLFEMGLAGTGVGLASIAQNPTDPTAVTALVAAALSFGARRGAAHVDQNVVRHIATVLTSQDPAVRQRALQQVAHNGRAMAALRSLDEAYTGLPRAAAMQQGADAVNAEVQPERQGGR